MTTNNAQQSFPELALGTSVKAQAKLRVVVGGPIVIALMIGVAGFASPLIIHLLYIAAIGVIARQARPSSLAKLAYVTAVLDPLMLSATLSVLGEYGGLVIGFYLFTILGFGFRIGLRHMFVCQVVAIIGFIVVLGFAPYWVQHPVSWTSFMLTLILIPLYATVLLKKLHEARARAEQASEAKSELLAKVSHELRTPLSGIVAATELLAAETQDAQTASRAHTILDLSHDLLDEINDLLDQSKYEAKALTLESAPFKIDDQVERVRLSVQSAAEKKGVTFRIDRDPRIVDSVQGDAHYLGRVLLNLAGNAVKFTDQGEIRIGMLLVDQDAASYRIRFSVQDTGIGIAAEYHEQIFEPFAQGEQGTTRRHGGTGLGMTIAKEIVNLMGGELRLESEPGKGSLFYFELQLPRVLVPSQLPVDVQPAAEVVYAIEPKVISAKRVFVADDNETNLTLIKELLELDGHQVAVAGSGMDALDVLSAQEFDVLFLDFNLGQMDGAELLQIYRFGKLHAAPAFFLTADATALTTSRLESTGALGVLNKPITQEELRRAVGQACLPRAAIDAIKTPVQVKQVRSEAAPVQAASKPVRPILTAVATQFIDRAVIEGLKSISSRPQFIRELLSRAHDDIQRNCDDLVQALGLRNFERIRDAAHALKGVSASVGATRLVSLATRLMQSSIQQQKPVEAGITSEVVDLCAGSLAAIRELIAEFEPAQSGKDSLLHTN